MRCLALFLMANLSTVRADDCEEESDGGDRQKECKEIFQSLAKQLADRTDLNEQQATTQLRVILADQGRLDTMLKMEDAINRLVGVKECWAVPTPKECQEKFDSVVTELSKIDGVSEKSQRDHLESLMRMDKAQFEVAIGKMRETAAIFIKLGKLKAEFEREQCWKFDEGSLSAQCKEKLDGLAKGQAEILKQPLESVRQMLLQLFGADKAIFEGAIKEMRADAKYANHKELIDGMEEYRKECAKKQ